MSDQTPEVPETGLPAEAEQVVSEAVAPAEVVAPEAATVVEEVVGAAPAPPDAVTDVPPAPAPPAGSVPPPPAYGAAVAAVVPVFPNGKPMLDATGQPVSDKSRLAAALLCWFVGVLGVHRFYVGQGRDGRRHAADLWRRGDLGPHRPDRDPARHLQGRERACPAELVTTGGGPRTGPQRIGPRRVAERGAPRSCHSSPRRRLEPPIVGRGTTRVTGTTPARGTSF